MKRKVLSPLLNKAALAVPAAAMMLGAAHGAQIGINFQDNWYGTSYAPLTDTSAFGIPLADWINAPAVENSGFTAAATNATISLSGGGDLRMAWSFKNTYSLPAAIPTLGDDQVIYGYLDDSDYGYSVTLSGLRAFAGSFTITTIASTDQGSATGFQDVNVTSLLQTNTLQYLANYVPSFASGLAGTSTVSTAFATLGGNDSVTIKGVARSGNNRSCLAGILIQYTPATDNPPLIESNPQAPVGLIYPGGSFVLNALGSGAPGLSYQWRQDGVDIPGANSASYTNGSAVVGDTGDYDVVVTNAYGSVTSGVAQVTIQNVVSPVITEGPRSQSLYEGYPATFKVVADGGLLAFQWTSNSVPITGATNDTYTIASVTPADAATYAVEVDNPVGPTASASATLTVKVPTPGSYEAFLAQSQPIVWMRYSETGAVTQDTASNAGSLGATGNGIYLGSVAHPVTGALVGSTDKAASFSGGKVSVPYNASINPAGAFTVEAWFKASAASGTHVIVQSMINGENPVNTSDRNGWALRQSGADVQFLAGTDLGAPFYYYYTVAGAITAGQWQHVVVSYDGTVPTIYLNGAVTVPVVTRQDGVAMTQQEIDAIRVVPNTAAPLIVGDRGYGGWAFTGGIDEVAVYPSALSGAQALEHYQNGMSATPSPAYNTLVTGAGAVEYLRLNELSSLTVATNSGTFGSAWNGSYVDGGTTLGSPQIVLGQVGPRPPAAPGLESDNLAVGMTNGFTMVPLTDALNVNTVTVCGWVYRQDPSSGNDLSFLAWLGDGGLHMNSDGELRYHWKGSKWSWSSGLFVPAQVWTFVAWVVEPSKATMYMSDGNVLLSAVNTTTHDAMAVTTPIELGAQPGRADRTYIGRLDESAVYARSLSATEINTLFLVGSGAPYDVGIIPGGVIEDTKPVGTPHHGQNTAASCVWTNSVQDVYGTNRLGVETFTAATPSQIVIPADPDFNTTTGTIMFWLRADAPLPGPGSEAAMLMDRRTSNGMIIGLNTDGTLQIQCAGGANSFAVGYLPDSAWHHVAVAYDQSVSGSIAVYIDGLFYASNPNASAWSWPTNQQIELGQSHDGYWLRFDGHMDDFRIYNRVLTDMEVASVHSGDALVDTSALKLRYNFDDQGIGYTVTWPFGTLLSSPTLGPSAVWTPVAGAKAPGYPVLPTAPTMYFRATP